MTRTWAMIFGWVLVVVGVLGFVPNPIVGNGAIFHTDLMHNVIHIILGAALLWAAYAAREKAAMVLKVEGVIFLVLAVLGWFTVSGTGSLMGLAEVNGADHLLHLVLGAVFLWAGWKGGEARDMQTI